MNRTPEAPSLSAALIEAIERPNGAPWRPPVEVVRTARGLTFAFDLPGVLAKNVHVRCAEGRLWVWGCRSSAASPMGSERRTNRPSGPFAIDTLVGDAVDASRIAQELKDGVLTVVLPTRRASVKRAGGGR